MKILGHHRLYGDSRFNSAFPSVCSTADGGLLLAFRRARDSRALDGTHGLDLGSFVTHLDPRSHLALMRLDASGVPLESPRIAPVCAEAADQDPNLLALSDGSIVLASFSWNPMCAGDLALPGFGVRGPEGVGRLHAYWFSLWGSNLRRSCDHGASFSEPVYLPAGPRRSAVGRGSHGGALRGRMVEHEGLIYLASYWAPGRDGQGLDPQLYVSEDQGLSFEHRGSIARDPEQAYTYAEPSLYRSPTGRLWCFLRTFQMDDATALCWSDDDGVTWTEPQPTALIGHPVDPVPLSDGRVLLLYGYRQPDFGVRARLWDGQNPDLGADELIVRDDGRSADLGYPWGVQLADGTVLVTYYFSDESGVRCIESTRVSL